MRALALLALALLAGCGSTPPASDGTLTATWTRVEVLTDGEPSGPVTYVLDCWSTTGGRRTVAVGGDTLQQVLRLSPGFWSCDVRAISDVYGTSERSNIGSKSIP